jgi:hypothetical protein
MSEISISRNQFTVELEGLGEAGGELIRFLAPRTVDSLLRLLPLHGRVSISNAQIYFEVPLKAGYEKAVSKVERGDVAYWPFGSALCFFKESMQPYRPVNLVGKILSGLEVFQNVANGTPIKVERS